MLEVSADRAGHYGTEAKEEPDRRRKRHLCRWKEFSVSESQLNEYFIVKWPFVTCRSATSLGHMLSVW